MSEGHECWQCKGSKEPRRVRVTRAAGVEVFPGGVHAADPPKAQAHMDELGWMTETFNEDIGRCNPRILLDSRDVIWGFECWWSFVTQMEAV